MKKLMFPQEFDVWYILPAIKKKLALKLIEKGIPQKEVAEILKTTPATISHYKKDKRVKEDILGDKIDNLIIQAANKINQDNNLFFHEVIKINNQIKEQGLFCKIFQEKLEMNIEELPCYQCQKQISNVCH